LQDVSPWRHAILRDVHPDDDQPEQAYPGLPDGWDSVRFWEIGLSFGSFPFSSFGPGLRHHNSRPGPKLELKTYPSGQASCQAAD